MIFPIQKGIVMPRPINTASVLWSKVDKRGPDECWPWLGGRNHGYGRFEVNGRNYYAHRAIYHLLFPLSISIEGPIDRLGNGFLRHSCDNPPCCNPAHLILGTQLENAADKVRRGRSPDFSGDKGPNCKLTMEDVFWIKLMKKQGATMNALALLHGVSRMTIKAATTGRSYR